MNADILEEEQRETARELAELMHLAQKMGQRLANETHGDLYDEARALMSLLHQTRAQADLIDARLSGENIDVAMLVKQAPHWARLD